SCRWFDSAPGHHFGISPLPARPLKPRSDAVFSCLHFPQPHGNLPCYPPSATVTLAVTGAATGRLPSKGADMLTPSAVTNAKPQAAAYKRKAEQAAGAETFEAIAREWFAKYSPNWAPGHSSKIIRRLELDVFPWIGGKPIASITAPDVLAVLRRIESRGVIETAYRAKTNIGQ